MGYPPGTGGSAIVSDGRRAILTMKSNQENMDGKKTHCVDVFEACCSAIRKGVLTRRSSRDDKEFHFQNWFADRFRELGIQFDKPLRNSYPDFKVVEIPEGYEIKGLAYPGREANYDANSQVPSGHHNGRDIYYVFGRYPSDSSGNELPIVDLVVCHGDFLNADHDYVHNNRNIKGF
jgi:hypothetical protein